MHARSRRWHVVLQALWWILLLPIALVCWGASLRRVGLRVVAWVGAALVLLIGVSAVFGTTGSTKGATSTTSAPASTTVAPTTSPPTTVAITSLPPATTTPFTAAPTTVAASTTTAPAADAVSALDTLAAIPVANEHGDGYDRNLFPLWTDDNHSGCDTRAEILLRDATTPPQQGAKCDLTGGT